MVTATCTGVYKWRDEVARVEDESSAYVLPKAQLVKLSQVRTADEEIRRASNFISDRSDGQSVGSRTDCFRISQTAIQNIKNG